MKIVQIQPVQIPGKGWDVALPDGSMLCGGRAPFTLAQAQVAVGNARRDYARHGIEVFKPEGIESC